MRWLIVVLAVAGGIVLLTALVIWVSGLMFAMRTGQLRDALVAGQLATSAGRPDMPEIVRAYAVRAGGQLDSPLVFHARQKAMLATAVGSAPIAVTAEQWTGTASPGFVWAGHGTMSGLPVSVVDSYVDGSGALSARILGAVPVAGGSGPDYDVGEMMRYLSELPLYPDAILNAEGLVWRQVDAATVEVRAETKGGPAVVRFMFDAGGDIVGLEADDRPMARDDGTVVPTPWRGLYSEYKQFGRYRIPAYGEVGWVLADGLFTYWRGNLVSYGAAE